MPRFEGYKSKTSKKDKSDKPFPLRLTFTEETQPDDYIIPSLDDLYSKTVRVWNGPAWNNNVMNGATGALFTSSHHVPGEGAKSRKAFKDGKFGFCLEWIDVEHHGTVHRVRCMNEFSVKSQQCTDHPKAVFKDGPNRVYDLLNWGKTVTYGMIKDSGAHEAQSTDQELKAKALGELAELQSKLDDAVQNGQDVEELSVELAAREKAISNKSYCLLESRADTPLAICPPATSGAIYNSRTAVRNSAPGNAVLDAKAKRNSNDKRKGKTDYARGLTKGLGTIGE